MDMDRFWEILHRALYLAEGSFDMEGNEITAEEITEADVMLKFMQLFYKTMNKFHSEKVDEILADWWRDSRGIRHMAKAVKPSTRGKRDPKGKTGETRDASKP